MLAEDKGRVEQKAGYLLARGIDVQLTLEDVVDDRLGQVIHNVAIPMLQGQPAFGGADYRHGMVDVILHYHDVVFVFAEY